MYHGGCVAIRLHVPCPTWFCSIDQEGLEGSDLGHFPSPEEER